MHYLAIFKDLNFVETSMEPTRGHLSSSLSLLNDGNVLRTSQLSPRAKMLAAAFSMLIDRIALNRRNSHRGDILKMKDQRV
jgi:hypothetical protein